VIAVVRASISGEASSPPLARGAPHDDSPAPPLCSPEIAICSAEIASCSPEVVIWRSVPRIARMRPA
jgi:hypothetical protein